jgi:hypothetical protein
VNRPWTSTITLATACGASSSATSQTWMLYRAMSRAAVSNPARSTSINATPALPSAGT